MNRYRDNWATIGKIPQILHFSKLAKIIQTKAVRTFQDYFRRQLQQLSDLLPRLDETKLGAWAKLLYMFFDKVT